MSTTASTLENLRTRILSQYPLLFLKTWEEERWERELSELAMEVDRGLVIWSATDGLQPPPSSDSKATDPVEFLEQIAAYPPDHLFLIKDFHPFLSDPRVIRKLRDLTLPLTEQNKTLMFIGPVTDVPLELRKDAVAIDLPLPELEELRYELSEVLAEADGQTVPELTSNEEERLLNSVLGLTAREARKALARAVIGHETVDEDVYAALVSEKKHLVEGSDLLDFYDLDAGVKDVGGLDTLKDWISKRAAAFSVHAREQGMPTPKGLLLLGVQGCGKSLVARATAKLLSFPLVRLDIANLLAAGQGSSEQNMRAVLRLIEAIAPAVLWLDEIEKGFAGVTGDNQDATMSRLLGQFLTWMQEHTASVFVVATANSIGHLPPEMLRRGRFDELFFVDLPNHEERKDIFRIHLKRRGWKPEKYDIHELSSQTEAYSGAEIEQIVISAMLDSYGAGGLMSQHDLEVAREQTVPLSVTMEEQIFELREWARTRCRLATPDSRVMQMLEEEKRHGDLDVEHEDHTAETRAEWAMLADHGRLGAAVVEFIRHSEGCTFPRLQETFAEFIDAKGGTGLALRSDPNVVLWIGMSRELTDLMAKLIGDKRIYLHPVDVQVYRDAGKALKLPLIEKLPEKRLVKSGWFPVSLRTTPQPGGSGRFARVARVKFGKSPS